MTDTIADVDADTGRLVPTEPRPRAWMVVYGDRLEREALFHDRGAAERAAVNLHGQLVALYAWLAPPCVTSA